MWFYSQKSSSKLRQRKKKWVGWETRICTKTSVIGSDQEENGKTPVQEDTEGITLLVGVELDDPQLPPEAVKFCDFGF